MISHDNVGDLSLTINQKTDLAAYIMGEPAYIAGKFKCNEELGWKAAAVKIFKPADLTGLKPAGIPKKPFHIKINSGGSSIKMPKRSRIFFKSQTSSIKFQTNLKSQTPMTLTVSIFPVLMKISFSVR